MVPKSRLAILFIIIVLASVSTIYWKIDKDFYKDKLQWNEAQSRAQISALTTSIETELEGTTQILDLAYSQISEMSTDYKSDQVYSRFQMISKIQRNSNDWILEKKFFLESSPVKNWGASYSYLSIKGLNAQSLNHPQILIILDPQRKPWALFVAASQVTNNTYAAILNSDFLQNIVDRQKGQLSSISIVNQQGQVIGHSYSEYIGSILTQDPIVQELMNSGNASGSGQFLGLEKDKVQGFYQQVGSTNIYITLSTSLKTLLAGRDQLKMKFIFAGIGISLIGLAFIFLLFGEDEKPSVNPAIRQAKKSEVKKQKTIAVPGKKIEEVSRTNIKIPFEAPTLPSQKRFSESLNFQENEIVNSNEKNKESIKESINEAALDNLEQDPHTKGFANAFYPPPLPSSMTDAHPDETKNFEELFSDKKIKDTFNLIDSLDLEAPKKEEAGQDMKSKEKNTEAVSVSNFTLKEEAPLNTVLQEKLVENKSQPTIEYQAATRKLDIKFEPKKNKLDSFKVNIRKPQIKSEEIE